jgi:hypothetical protein
MTGIFTKLANFFKGSDRRKLKFINKQQELAKKPIRGEIKIRKCRHDGTQRGIAFIKRLLKRRAKKLMCINTNRRIRGLFAY